MVSLLAVFGKIGENQTKPEVPFASDEGREILQGVGNPARRLERRYLYWYIQGTEGFRVASLRVSGQRASEETSTEPTRT